MKLKSLTLFLILISSGCIFAQDFYLKLNGGYGIGFSTQTDYDYNFTETAPGVSTSSYKSRDYSFGKGTYFSAAAGYFMNQSLGFEMELQYLHGASIPSHREFSYLLSSKYTYDYENYATLYMLNPSFILRTQLSVFKPYLKIGPVISFGTIHINNTGQSITPDNIKSTSISEIQYSGGVIFGLNASIGAAFEIYRNIDLSIEINNKNMSYAPEEGEIVKYTVNGVDRLQQLPTASKKVIFTENLVSSSSYNENSPSKERKQYYPFGSFSLQFGVSYSL